MTEFYIKVEDGAYSLSSAMLKQSPIGEKGLSFSALLVLTRKDRLGILCTNHEEENEKSAFHSHGRRCGIHRKNTRDTIKCASANEPKSGRFVRCPNRRGMEASKHISISTRRAIIFI